MVMIVTVIALSPAWAFADKIGGVNLQAVFEKSDTGKGIRKKIESDIEKETSLLKQKRALLEKLGKELSEQRALMRAEVLEDKKAKFDRLKREYKLLEGDTRKKLQREQGRATATFMKDVLLLLKSYGVKNGYTLIVERSGAGSVGGPVVLYLDSKVDLTDEIIKLYDARKKSPK